MKIPTLITIREALKILTWCTYHNVYSGERGTRGLTRYPNNLLSKEECEALRDSIIAAGRKPFLTAPRKARAASRRPPKELV